MDRLDHTNLDFEQLAASCSPFVQDLVMYVITNMHEELEAFLKENCQGVDDEDLHKHRYWDMFQGKTHMFHCCNRLIRSNVTLVSAVQGAPLFLSNLFYLSLHPFKTIPNC